MITPDKIYIPYYPNYDGIDTHLSDEWFEGKAIDHVEGWKEYIRKDALLEWANNWKKLGVSEDFLYAMETLVQHLNSM